MTLKRCCMILGQGKLQSAARIKFEIAMEKGLGIVGTRSSFSNTITPGCIRQRQEQYSRQWIVVRFTNSIIDTFQ